MEPPSVDHILEKIGSLGIYQTRLLCILSWVLLFNIGYPYLLLTFLIYEPPWRCVTNSSVCTITEDIKPGHEHFQLRCGIARDQWEYTGARSSVITEFELICDNTALGVVSPTVFFIGTLVSDCFCGILSDKIGRKPVMMVFGVCASIFSLGAAFSYNYWLYSACRFFVGLSYSSTFIPLYTLSTEFVGVSRRHVSGTMLWTGWAFTVMLLAGVAYLLNNWRHVTLAGAVPGFLILGFWWFIPESVRFLLLKGKIKEAEKSLKKIAKTNRREYPDDYPIDELVYTEEQRKGSFLDLVRTRKMLHLTVSVFFISFIVTVVYLAVIISSPSLGGNMYLNVFLVGLIEIPANLLGMVVIKRFGRRNVISVTLIGAAVGAFLTMILRMFDPGDHQGYAIGRLASSLLAKLAIDVSADTLTIYSAECFPTIIRGTGFAVANAGVDIGGIVSPFIIKLDHFNPILPYGVIGGVALLAGLECLTLKETGDKPTSETLNDENCRQLSTITAPNDEDHSDQVNIIAESKL